MINNPWDRLADILVNYSTEVKKGERVLITMMEIETFPLALSVYTSAIKSGGLPYIEFQSAYLERSLLKFGDDQQLNWVPEIQADGMKWADVYIGLRGARNPSEFGGIDNSKLIAHKRVMGKISALRNDETRWVLVRVPNESLAQQAQFSLEEMMDFFFNATLLDWEREAKRFKEIRNVFQASTNVRIIGSGTDLSFSTSGRTYVVADGHFNMPDGEIFTCPVDDSTEGNITFDFPGIYAGQTIKGIYLEFKHGQVVNSRSEDNEQLLHEILEMDDGAKKVGEFGVGTNFGIDRFCSDILYDEKIGGTIHIALGRAYKECGGVNQSALHWDLIKDLRKNGKIILDENIVFENGKYYI